jgi:hypothetical protein
MGVWELAFITFNGFFKVFDPSILRGHHFFNSIPFFTIFNGLYAPIGIQVLFRHQKQWKPPLGFSLP